MNCIGHDDRGRGQVGEEDNSGVNRHSDDRCGVVIMEFTIYDIVKLFITDAKET